MALRAAISCLSAGFCFLIATPAASQTEGDLCRGPLAAVAAIAGCAAAGSVAVIAPAESRTEYLGLIVEARARYERHFGAVPAPFVLVIGEGVPAAELERLRATGLLVLPWLSLAERLNEIEADIRSQIQTALPQLDAARREQVVAQFLERFRPNVAAGEHLAPQEAGIIQHEAAHLWFGAFFGAGSAQPRAPAAGARDYGSPAPDWLDEAAALVAENEALTRQRREGLGRAVQRGEAGPPLAQLLAMPHPWTTRPAGAAPPGTQTTVRIRVNQRESSQSTGDASLQYYILVRGLADFLVEESGRAQVLQEIAAELRRGGTFERWLAARPAPVAGVATMAELEARWQAWLRRRPAPAPAPIRAEVPRSD